MKRVDGQEEKAVTIRFIAEKVSLSTIPPYVIADNALRSGSVEPISLPLSRRLIVNPHSDILPPVDAIYRGLCRHIA